MTKLLLFLTIVSFNQITTQNKKLNRCNCCTEKHQQFDFWLGNWNVYNADGKLIGTNSITKNYGDCMLKEEWVSTGSNRGTSTNYYNKKDESWNQVWVDNSGYNLVLKGTFIDGRMVLKSEVVKGRNSEYYNQITWTPNNDGTVTQL
ncbi:MAG: hypothetical protein PSN34_14085 [Urechidicola sp.]|nr:hypothetical protein [Urechidicola sp.]